MKRLLILFFCVFLWPSIGWAQDSLFGKSYAAVVGIEPVGAEYVVVTNARVRKQSSIRSRQIGSLKKGQKVWVAGRTKVEGKTWFLVDLPDGQQGFVYENLIEEERRKAEIANLTLSQKVKEIARDGNFIAYANGTVKDTKTNLMWTAKDNGRDMTWQAAKKYCENYRGGGYMDWRMPTQDELAGLYDKSKTTGYGWSDFPIHVTKLIEITDLWVWASETRGSRAAGFIFSGGGRSWGSQSDSRNVRALPVRSGN